MHKAVISEIKKRLNTLFATDTDFFVKLRSGAEFAAHPVTEHCFHEINSALNNKEPFVGIDGGNNTLFSSSIFSLHVIRICAYKSAKEHTVYTFVLLVQQVQDSFELDLIPADVLSESFLAEFDYPTRISLTDSEFTRGGNQIEMQTLVNYMRRLLELRAAKQYKSVLIDGSLDTRYLREEELLESYYAEKKTVVGVCKTTSIVTENGMPATLYLSRLAPCASWFTKNLLVGRNFQVCFAKLSPHAHFVFRVDMPTYLDLQLLFSQLTTIATDATFAGYPYILIRADELARVSEEELQFMRNRFFGSLDSLTRRQLEQMRTTKSAHSVLDSMKF